MLKDIHWLGHASFRLDGSATVYIDPWKLRNPRPADIVLVTHEHHDHLSPDDIARLTKLETVIICPASCRAKLRGDVRVIKPGQAMTIGEVTVRAVPAYNTNKPNHPREAGHVGYVVEMDGRRVYHAGDTDLIPEMAEIGCDVAILPVGGTYTMTAKEAAEALGLMHPEYAVPMHYGDVVGSAKDAEALRDLAPDDVEVVILKKE
ncbi:MAG: MBL fold metallo-hydrolase [Chloroflexi bacterium]|jgi:L-ascorbate metabolism protein UlaG (beta-lactamase superfamily)|nr:MBL fold metallo-hydrolase [Chloroflexota bacterium]